MAEHAITKKNYYWTFVALMALLVLTVAVAYVHLGAFNIFVALSIAIVKATLVVLYFMHVRASDKMVWVFIAAGIVWFIVMIGLTASDFLTRELF